MAKKLEIALLDPTECLATSPTVERMAANGGVIGDAMV